MQAWYQTSWVYVLIRNNQSWSFHWDSDPCGEQHAKCSATSWGPDQDYFNHSTFPTPPVPSFNPHLPLSWQNHKLHPQIKFSLLLLRVISAHLEFRGLASTRHKMKTHSWQVKFKQNRLKNKKQVRKTAVDSVQDPIHPQTHDQQWLKTVVKFFPFSLSATLSASNYYS